MTQGPPCPDCGSLLRWFPDQQQWGCDRCRVMFPAQVIVTPQAYATKRFDAPRAKRRGKRSRSKRLLVYGAIAVVVAGGGAAVTLWRIHAAKPVVPSYPDRDTAVRETFAALGAGDATKIMAHAGARLAPLIMTCDPGAPNEQAGDLATMREELARELAQNRGVSFRVTKLEETGAPEVKQRGHKLSRGCTLDADYTIHTVHVGLELVRAGEHSTSDATLPVVEVGGKFYVRAAPRLGGCDGAAAQVAFVAGRETAAAELASKLSPAIARSCSDDKWPAKVIDCAAHALSIKDVRSCVSDLAPDQVARLSGAIGRAVDRSPAATQLLAMVPPAAEVALPPPPVPPVPSDPNVTLGASAPAGVADFWITPRSDGTYLVTSAIVTATFPAKPTAKVAKSTRPNADGKYFDIYTFALEPKPGVSYQLEIIAMGRDMRDEGGFKNLEAELAKVGKVAKADRTEDGRPVTRFTAGAIVLDGRIDLARGLIINSTATTDAVTRPTGQAFLASVHVRGAVDPVDDPDTLVGIRQRKGSRGKLELHDPDDNFTITVPGVVKVERAVEAAHHEVVVTAASVRRRPGFVLTISEMSAWDALAIGPTKLAALRAANKKAHLIWNAFQHRMYRVICTETPCDPIVKSLHFAEPLPVK
ncbi:MAG: hypothetical protein ABI467_01840 [Kofleriaceae bacterium]